MSTQECAAKLMETIPSIMQFIRTQMREQSASVLSVPQFRVLAFLSRHPGSSLTDLAEHLGVTRATASTMTERLVQRGFVSRADRPQERRHVVLELTGSGTAYLQQSRERTRDNLAVLLEDLSEEQLSSVETGLAILKTIFE